MVLNTEKRRQFAVVALQLRATPSPSTAATSPLGPSASALID